MPSSDKPGPRRLSISFLSSSYRLTIAAPAIFRRVFDHPCSNGVEVDIRCHHPRSDAIFHDDTFVAIFPQGAGTYVRAVEPFSESFE